MIIKLISVIIPCFNEDKTIEIIVEKIQKYKNHPLEIIIVDELVNSQDQPLVRVRIVIEYDRPAFSHKW